MGIDSGVGGEGWGIKITTYTPVEIMEQFAVTLMTRGVGGDAHHEGQGPCQGAQRKKAREGLDVAYLLHHSAYQLTKTHGVINTTPVYGPRVLSLADTRLLAHPRIPAIGIGIRHHWNGVQCCSVAPTPSRSLPVSVKDQFIVLLVDQ